MKDISSDARIDLLVQSGQLVPEETQMIDVWTKGNTLLLNFADLDKVDELYIFVWQYYKKKPYFMTKYELYNKSTLWNVNKRLFEELQNDKTESVRLAYVYRKGNKCECGFLRKHKMLDGMVPEEERIVWKMPAEKNKEYVIYWTPQGFLCLRFGTEKTKELERKLSLVKWKTHLPAPADVVANEIAGS